jgi:hypothetical protein
LIALDLDREQLPRALYEALQTVVLRRPEEGSPPEVRWEELPARSQKVWIDVAELMLALYRPTK